MFDKKYKQIIKILVAKVDKLEKELSHPCYSEWKRQYNQKQARYFEHAKNLIKTGKITSELKLHPLTTRQYKVISGYMTLVVTLYPDTKDICATLSYDDSKTWYDITLQEYKEQLLELLTIIGNSDGLSLADLMSDNFLNTEGVKDE